MSRAFVNEDNAAAQASQWPDQRGAPLVQALLGARLGDEVLWKRPAGDQMIEITRIDPAWWPIRRRPGPASLRRP